MAVRALLIALVVASTSRALAQGAPEVPPEVQTPAELLRAGNEAAVAGDWDRVSALVGPVLDRQLAPADLAEAHRLAGLAEFFRGDRASAEIHFLAYLRIDLDGGLDAALYPPEVIVFFTDVKTKYAAELRARRPKARRYLFVSPIPVASQFQNGQRTKGIVLASTLVILGGTNVISYGLLHKWCDADRTCDARGDHTTAASRARVVNIVSGIGLLVSVAYGVIDGATGYRRVSRERTQPIAFSDGTGAFVGLAGSF